MEEAQLQSRYDGASLVYARNQALDTIGKPYLAGHAKVTTFTTDGTNLNLFAHYATPTENGKFEYHQYPIESTNLIRSYEGFKEGRKQLRYAQDLAREESCRLRDELKDYWRTGKSQPVPLPTINDEYEVIEPQPDYHPNVTKEAHLPVPDLQPPAATSAYEEPAPYEEEADEDNYEIVEQPCQPTPAASTESRKASRPHNSGRKRKALPPSPAPPRPRRSKAKA